MEWMINTINLPRQVIFLPDERNADMNITVESVMCPIAEEDVTVLLEAHGIYRDSGNLEDYSRAKRIIFKGKFIDCDEYDMAIGWIREYIGV